MVTMTEGVPRTGAQEDVRTERTADGGVREKWMLLFLFLLLLLLPLLLLKRRQNAHDQDSMDIHLSPATLRWRLIFV